MPNLKDTRIDARWIIPVIPRGEVYQDHSLIIHQDKIIDILPQNIAASRYQIEQHFQLGEQVLLPGFINAHTHTPMSLLRGLADDLPLMTWLQEHIWPAEAQFVSPEFVRDGSELAIAEMLLGGTTCFNDMYFFPEQTAMVADRIGMRCVLGQIIIDFPSAYAEDADDYLNKGLTLYERYQNNPLISTTLAPHAPYTVNNDNLNKALQSARKYHLPVHIHCHETSFEVSDAFKKDGVRPLKRLHDLGLVNEKLIAVHMTQLNQQDLDLIKQQHSHVVHCPESNMKLASGTTPISQLIAQGNNVALGTDGAASNNDLDMIAEMRSAALLAKVSSQDATAINAQTAIEMATINGAKALGLEKLIGSLEIGKQADIISIDMRPWHCQPIYNIISQIVYTCQSQQVSHVWCNGRLQLQERKLLHIDEQQLAAKVAQWKQKIQSI